MRTFSKDTKAMFFLIFSFFLFTVAVYLWPMSGKQISSKAASIILIILGIFSIAISINIAGWKAYKDAFKASFPRIRLKIRR